MPNRPSQQWDPGTSAVLSPSTSSIGFVTAVMASMATVTMGTLQAGEDLTADVMKVEHRYSYQTLSSSTTVAVKSGAGFLHLIHVGSVSCPSTAFWDNTVPGTTLIARLPAGAPPGTYLFDVPFSTGLTIDSVGGAAPSFTVSYR